MFKRSPIDAKQRIIRLIAVLTVIATVTIGIGFRLSLLTSERVGDMRTRQLMRFAISYEMRSLERLVLENAQRPEVRTDAYLRREAAHLPIEFRALTRAGGHYQIAALLDASGRQVRAVRDGGPASASAEANFNRAAKPLLAKLRRGKGCTSSLVAANGDIFIVAAANIWPLGDKGDALAPGARPLVLVQAKRLTSSVATHMGNDLGLRDVRFGDASATRPSLRLTNKAGQTIGVLSWASSELEGPALKGLIWITALVAGGLLLAIGYVVHQGIGITRTLYHQARTDTLSKLPNRRAFRLDAARAIAAGEPLAAAILDLDGFKRVNDFHGHHVGDQLIIAIADMGRTLLENRGMFARLGGDEFAILLTGKDARRDLELVARHLLKMLSTPFEVAGVEVAIGVSIGLVGDALDISDPSELLRRADIAMYGAKAAGKNRYQWYDARMDERRARAFMLEAALQDALSTDEFSVAYQPICDAKGQRIVAVEALVRWKSASFGAISPDVFIPVAEQSTIIDRIGNTVLRRACRDALDWKDVMLAVNVSGAQLRNRFFAAQVRQILAETGFPAHRLELEVTETFLIEDVVTTQMVLQELAGMGITLVLDDFGTGYSSISMAANLPFSHVKIDRTLVARAVDSAAYKTLVEAIITGVHALGAVVTAEGVEGPVHAHLMQLASCDRLQGWHFGKPVRAHELAQLVGITNTDLAAA